MLGDKHNRDHKSLSANHSKNLDLAVSTSLELHDRHKQNLYLTFEDKEKKKEGRYSTQDDLVEGDYQTKTVAKLRQ